MKKPATEYMDLKALASYACMSVSCLRDYIHSGDLPAFKIKGKVLVKRSEFDAWMDSNRIIPDWQALADKAVNQILNP